MPGWFPGIQEVWKEAMSHIHHSEIAPRESPRRFVLPPIHLFWGVEPHNQRVHYHHYLLLFNEIKNWPVLQSDYITHADKLDCFVSFAI